MFVSCCFLSFQVSYVVFLIVEVVVDVFKLPGLFELFTIVFGCFYIYCFRMSRLIMLSRSFRLFRLMYVVSRFSVLS